MSGKGEGAQLDIPIGRVRLLRSSPNVRAVAIRAAQRWSVTHNLGHALKTTRLQAGRGLGIGTSDERPSELASSA
jgi:hypothetical protein